MNRSAATVHIFIDGSFHPTQGAGYGFVAVSCKHRIIFEQAEPIYDEDYQTSTSAELIAALRATKWAEKQGYRFINIHHDYSGVGTTAANPTKHYHPLHSQYFEFFQDRLMHNSPTQVYFHKVEAHTGNAYNTRADKLATAGRKRNLRRQWLTLTKRFGRQHPALSLFQAKAYGLTA